MESRIEENLVKALFYILLMVVLSVKVLFFDGITKKEIPLHARKGVEVRMEER